MFSITSQFETANGSKYLQQLCKHFAHKIDVEWDEQSGKAAFERGQCEMTADQSAISFKVSVDEKRDLPLIKYIIDDHLTRFAHRETVLLNWAWAARPK